MVLEDQRKTSSVFLLLKAKERVMIFALELSFVEGIYT